MLAKSAAVVSSVVLLCGYVYDRAGGNLFHGHAGSVDIVSPSEGAPAMMPGSKSAAVWAPEDDPFAASSSIASVSRTEEPLPSEEIPADDPFAAETADADLPEALIPADPFAEPPAPTTVSAAVSEQRASSKPRRREMLPGSKAMPGVIAVPTPESAPQPAGYAAPSQQGSDPAWDPYQSGGEQPSAIPKRSTSKRRMMPGSKSATIVTVDKADVAAAAGRIIKDANNPGWRIVEPSSHQVAQPQAPAPRNVFDAEDTPAPEPAGDDPFAIESKQSKK